MATLTQLNKCNKVRPLMNMIQERSEKIGIMTKYVNVDESIIPSHGKFGQKQKQRIPLKPIRSG